MKLCILFPGIGYHCGKPLLQRAALLPSLLLPCALGLVSAVLFGIWLTPGTAQK